MPEVPSIAFIGGGNMARSLIGGLIDGGHPPGQLMVADPDPAQRERLQMGLGVRTSDDNLAAAAQADVVVLAVKPQMLQGICRSLAALVQERQPLLISVAAGVRSGDIERWLGGRCALVRCMPNTPALVRSGATALCANAHVTPAQHDQAESILRAVGIAIWIEDEAQLDAVTALSGSGPAYVFLLMESMAEAGESMGLQADQARLLTLETVFGAAKMALESQDGPAALRRGVTSPGGTTERAIDHFESAGLRKIVRAALQAAQTRAGELGDLMGRDE